MSLNQPPNFGETNPAILQTMEGLRLLYINGHSVENTELSTTATNLTVGTAYRIGATNHSNLIAGTYVCKTATTGPIVNTAAGQTLLDNNFIRLFGPVEYAPFETDRVSDDNTGRPSSDTGPVPA